MAENDVRKHLVDSYLKYFPLDAARTLSTFTTEEAINYLSSQPISVTGNIFSKLNPEESGEILEVMEPHFFMELIDEIDVFLAARLIARFSPENIITRLNLLSPRIAKQIKELISYPTDCAAFMMDSRVTTFKQHTIVEKALEKIRNIKNRNIYQVFLVDDEGHLTGVVTLQKIAVSESNEELINLTEGVPVSVNALAPREEVVQLIEDRKFINIPVVDINNYLLGVIRNDALIDATKLDASQDVQALFGAGREERALSKVSLAVKKRLPWLQINLATAFLAASVVALFEDTIARITVLAVFLPVVAGQSGNTGSQALAVTMRGLALREISISQWFVVARKEILVGTINGVAVALTTAIIVFFWASSFGLAIVIGISMILSMAIAGLSGALIPMVLQSLGQDPASSSSIILTTVTDIVGFLSFLGLATALSAALGIV